MFENYQQYKNPILEGVRLPKIHIEPRQYEALGVDSSISNYDFLRKLCWQTMQEKGIDKLPNAKDYYARTKYELETLKELGFDEYILLNWEILNFCHENKIPTGDGRGCLNFEAPVLTRNGYKPLGEIQAGEMILNRFGKWAEVLQTHKYKCSEKLLKIKTFGDSNSDISMTGDHKVLVVRNPFKYKGETKINPEDHCLIEEKNSKWIRADEIKMGDYVIRSHPPTNSDPLVIFDLAKYADSYDDESVYETHAGNKTNPLSKKEIRRKTGIALNCLTDIQQRLPTVRQKSLDRLNEYLATIDKTLEEFYSYCPTITYKLPRYIEFNEKFAYVLGFFLGDGWFVTKDSRSIGFAFNRDVDAEKQATVEEYFEKFEIGKYWNNSKTKKLNQFTINSRILNLFFQELVPGKGKEKIIPWQFLNQSENILKNILAGLIDSDGHKALDGRVCFDNTSKILAFQVRNLMERFGDVCSCMSRNQENCEESFKIQGRKGASTHYYSANRNGFTLNRVKNISEVINESGYVYDLSIEGDPSYHTDNFIVHNSAAGSLAVNLVKVTKIDPLKHELFFERFVSKSRAKKIIGDDGITYLDGSLVPDIDNDIDYSRRHEVIKFIEEKHAGKTCKILTLNTLSGKACIKECLKIVEGCSEDEAVYVADSIPKKFGKVLDFEEAIKESAKFAELVQKYPKAYSIALKLEGLIKNTGVHPSGIAICHDLLIDTMPSLLTKEGELVSGYEMNDVAAVAVKFDILGLRTLTVLNEVSQATGVPLDSVNIEDEETYKFLQNLHSPQGLFQIETDTGYQVCQKVRPKNIYDLSAILALARPGALAYVDQYAAYSNTGEFQSIHPFFDDIFKFTGGIPLYQEELLSAARKIGFTADEGEQLRRCITGDTRFLSKSRGWIKIETLLRDGYEGDLFLLMDGSGKQSWKPIKNIWSNGVKQIHYVESKSGLTVKATQYHQFLTDSGWKSRMRLNKDEDFLVTTFDIPETGKKSISDDWVIVLAGMMTEGYFVHGSNPTFTNYDKDVYDLFLNAAQNIFGLENVVCRPCGRVISLKGTAPDALGKFLKRGKSRIKDIPEIIFSQDKRTIARFISFVLACEATITNREVSITSASRGLLQKLQLLISYFGIRTSLNTKTNKDHGDYWRLEASRSFRGKYLKKIIEEFSFYLQGYKAAKIKEYLSFQEDIQKASGFNDEDVPMSLVKKFINQYPYIPYQLDTASGRLYSGEEKANSLNREMFERFCEASGDKQWIDFSNGKQTYQRIHSLSKEIREVEVFDFTVDEDTPYIVANGIVIHNCVAKKKVEETEKWKEKIEQKVKENNLDPKIGDVLWKIAEDSAGYSFNFSHSISYANCSFKTAYFKVHYPQQFFLSLLRMAQHEPDPFAEIFKIHQELPLFNIRLLPPDLVKSSQDFSIEGKDLRFGLNSIKGVSEKTLSALLSFRDKEFQNKYEIFLAAKDVGLSIGILQTLIQAGCMDSFNTERCLLVLEARMFNELTDKEKIKVIELGERHNHNILIALKEIGEGKLLDEKGKPAISQKRIETLREKYKTHRKIYDQNHKHKEFANWFFEKKLLGYSYSYTLRQVFQEPEHSFTPVLRAKSFDDGQEVKIVGVVTDSIKKKSKKGNNYMSLELSDETGRIRAMLGDSPKEKKLEKWLENNKQPEEDQIVILVGKKSKDTIFIDKLTIMDEIIAFNKKDLKE